eukprot:TRINITY_DN5538_c0_g1_i1.p1 TRINITY_DN5538_c0_g1~~TRINITY_DN5538_c0_g1_i1.p1  ORF type:complete len:699 (-),score=108.79 TRINITY_DN5538_c0_g1_i1:196-2145(-)
MAAPVCCPAKSLLPWPLIEPCHALASCYGCTGGLLKLAGARPSCQHISITSKISTEFPINADGQHDLDIGGLIAVSDHQRTIDSFCAVQCVIGEGGFGKVWKVVHKATGMAETVKCISKSSDEQSADCVVAEIQSLLRLDHPNVSRICQWFESEATVYIVMELINGQDLTNYVQDSDVPLLFYQLMKAITYCHAKSVVHRDIKLENCLVEESCEKVLKLIDFGLAATWKPTDPDMTSRCGTIYYLSPNIVQGLPYSSKCDIWAAGVVLYILMTDEHPFCRDAVQGDTSRERLFFRVLNRPIRTQPLSRCGATAAENQLVSNMLSKAAEQRPTAAQILDECRLIQQEGPLDADFDVRALLARAKFFSDHSTPLERAILRVVARHMDDDNLHPLRKAFEHVNTRGDGCISVEEMRAAFSLAGFHGDAASSLFKGTDGAMPAAMEYTEWLIATMSAELISTEQSVLSAFHFLDFDSCGTLSKQDLEALGKDALADVMNLVAKDVDKGVGLDEFRRIMRSIAERRKRVSVTGNFGAPVQDCTASDTSPTCKEEAPLCDKADASLQEPPKGVKGQTPALPHLLGRSKLSFRRSPKVRSGCVRCDKVDASLQEPPKGVKGQTPALPRLLARSKLSFLRSPKVRTVLSERLSDLLR